MVRGTLRAYDRAPRWVNLTMAVIALASIALIFWYEAEEPTGELQRAAIIIDAVFVGVFVIDWLICLGRARDKKRFLLRDSWQLLGMIPLAFATLDFLRLLRLIQLIRAAYLVKGLPTKIRRWASLAHESSIYPMAMAATAITLVGSLLVWWVEHGENPELADYGEALWWAIVTVTTVGYGDITPITALGRAVAVLLMVTGIGVIGLLASNVAGALLNRKRRDQDPDPNTEPEPSAEEQSALNTTMVRQLKDLAQLYERGHLTTDEYERAKAYVLDEPN